VASFNKDRSNLVTCGGKVNM